MGTDSGRRFGVARGVAARELLLTVGLALAGVLLASLAALAPWYAGSPWAPEHRPPVTGFTAPAEPGTRG
jgi:hypothetical protein